MEDYYYKSSHVPAFGSWDWNRDLPFTQCFDTARQAGLLRYSYSEDRDLYVAGDLYENDVVTPAMIVVPRRRRKAGEHAHGNKDDGRKQSWTMSEEMEKTAASPATTTTRMASSCRPTPKPVDEDLYKISPHLLYSKSKKKGVLGFFSSCLLPTCLL
ncbi:Pathogenic type III effector avirulence factor Avr AvrRpt-cleavage: cleavage site protein [Melia azedarach]|uniref:Pathogenic type III effector avirulence factor Avr AvrRpt-cleavage: cleavage site protein n=1 Tax=Melia azedarach TaxID=155640 RepID=A0ACC1Z464_MELAZ|nr:Pathogenic type III effector avirulence factor Avr AvrRpt-cleavage: cleavage site protein [Melia azedarach]